MRWEVLFDELKQQMTEVHRTSAGVEYRVCPEGPVDGVELARLLVDRMAESEQESDDLDLYRLDEYLQPTLDALYSYEWESPCISGTGGIYTLDEPDGGTFLVDVLSWGDYPASFTAWFPTGLGSTDEVFEELILCREGAFGIGQSIVGEGEEGLSIVIEHVRSLARIWEWATRSEGSSVNWSKCARDVGVNPRELELGGEETKLRILRSLVEQARGEKITIPAQLLPKVRQRDAKKRELKQRVIASIEDQSEALALLGWGAESWADFELTFKAVQLAWKPLGEDAALAEATLSGDRFDDNSACERCGLHAAMFSFAEALVRLCPKCCADRIQQVAVERKALHPSLAWLRFETLKEALSQTETGSQTAHTVIKLDS